MTSDPDKFRLEMLTSAATLLRSLLILTSIFQYVSNSITGAENVGQKTKYSLSFCPHTKSAGRILI